ncbi:MAG: hypothetical protein RIB65_00465 [Ilumatobacter fluminis]|uniref:hypothetical protein n=1 Tax=Ilumatobacter fluminis TaxID=467091 RepID=UPI0032ECC698
MSLEIDGAPYTTPFVALPDEGEIARIAGLDDPVLRNLWITECYARFAHHLLDQLRTDQTWCTFAIWASNTAGVSIRQEELPHAVEHLLADCDQEVDAIVEIGSDHHPAVDWLVGNLHRVHIDRLIRQALGDVADHIAHGNALVFAELGPLFVRFIDEIERRDVVTAADVDDILRCAAIPTDLPLVRDAFHDYARAIAADDPTERAQYVLAANIAAVLHEQQRLQDDVASALDAGLVDVAAEVDRLCSRWLPSFVRSRVAEAAEQRVARHVARLWDHVATCLLMTMDVPGETLRLSRDVPPPAGGPLFPPALDPIVSDELAALLTAWDPTGGTGVGSGAHDWADLHVRMGFIVNLFRSRQQTLTLTTPPFTDEQLAHMAEGRRPPLD